MVLHLCTAHTVCHAHQWALHLFAKQVDHEEQVTRMVEIRGCMLRWPCQRDGTKIWAQAARTIITLRMLIHDPTGSLVRAICEPDPSNGRPARPQRLPEIVPHRLIHLFGKAIGMGGNDRDGSLAAGIVMLGDVMLDGHVQSVFLTLFSGVRVFANVLCGRYVLLYMEMLHGHFL